MVRVRYTKHALERLKQRGILPEEIETCLQSPDRTNKLDDVWRAVKKLDNKVLVVIYRQQNEEILVITAYKSSKTRKYLGL